MPWNFPYLGETEELRDAVRINVSGRFVQLSAGCTHYEQDDKQAGQPVVLVHGFSVPYFIWDPTYEFLRGAGFRVLRYDLLGRGYSDRPRVRYDIDLFCKQLKELLDTLGLRQVSLIGLSMGGPITASFTAHYPTIVKKLVLVDPAGAQPITFPQILKAVTTPGFGELAFGLFGKAQMARSVKSDFYDPAFVRAFVKKYIVQTKYKGFMRALLSTVRNGMLGDFSAAYREIGKLGIPALLFWGRDDKTVPFRHSEIILSAIPQIEFHVIEHCGHIPQYEKPEEFNPLLLEFLNEKE